MTEAPPPTATAMRTFVNPDLVEAARILHGALVRVHPSFRFEERLATRLDAAAALAHTLAGGDRAGGDPAGAARDPIPFPGPFGDGFGDETATDVLLPRARPVRHWRGPLAVGLAMRVPRGALIGGAIASGVSLAGAAILAQRWRARPPRSPFARAVRAAHRSAPGRGRVAPGGVA